MPDITNGVAASTPPPVRWRKSRRSNQGGNCVELAVLPEGPASLCATPGTRNGPALIHTHDEIAAFILGARDGGFAD